MDSFTRRKIYSHHKKLPVHGLNLIGPVFIVGCMSFIYLYHIATILQQDSEKLMMSSKPGTGGSFARYSASYANPWESELLQVLSQTHAGVTSHREPCNAHVSIVVDTPAFHTFDQVLNLIEFSSPHLNLHVYMNVKPGTKDDHTFLLNKLTNNSGIIPEDTSVDITMLEVPANIKQQTRTFRMAWHALYDLQNSDRKKNTSGFVLLLHRSCVIDLQWDVHTLLQGGRGFIFLHSYISAKTLYMEIAAHDLGITSGSLILHHNSLTHIPVPFHCSGSIMHALHSRHLLYTD